MTGMARGLMRVPAGVFSMKNGAMWAVWAFYQSKMLPALALISIELVFYCHGVNFTTERLKIAGQMPKNIGGTKGANEMRSDNRKPVYGGIPSLGASPLPTSLVAINCFFAKINNEDTCNIKG